MQGVSLLNHSIKDIRSEFLPNFGNFMPWRLIQFQFGDERMIAHRDNGTKGVQGLDKHLLLIM